MPRLTFLFIAIFLLPESAIAQNICGQATDEPPGCLLDTIYYGGVTNTYSTSSSVIPSVNGKFCDPIYQDAWLEIIPVCEEVTVRFRAISCTPRIPTYGIGVAIMDENFTVQSFCHIFPSVGFANRRFTVKDLIPGKRYNLMIYTGISSQRCQYNFEIQGIATFGLDNPDIHGEFEIGSGSRTKFYVEKEEPGTTYQWTAAAGVNIISGQGSPGVIIDAPTAGVYQLCCNITQPDGSSQNICKDITVSDSETIIQFTEALFCKGDCYNFFGECLNIGGHYKNLTTNNQGQSVLNVLELCKNPEPQVGIYGEPEIIVPGDQAPALLNGYLDRGNGDYTYQWLNGAGNLINNSNNRQLSTNRSDSYCFIATDNLTGCSDTACINLIITAPLPEPCGVAGDEPPGCALCGPVYTGSTAGYSRGPRPIGFCGTIENNLWLAFQASSTTATVSINSWDCLFNRGVQLYMIDPLGNPVSSCFSSGGTNTPGNITATGLIPGQVYYIMIDGFAGDICDFSISLVGGVNIGPPDPPQPIQADLTDPCPGQVVCYEIPPSSNASNYEWIVSGDGLILVGQGSKQICVQWGSSGTGEVCVVPFNPCFYGDTTCLPVSIVASSAVNNLPPMSFCENDFPLQPSDYCPSGINCPGIIPVEGKYCVNVGPSSSTCDSTVCYTFEKIPITRTIIDTFFCEGECLFWDNQQICSPDTIEFSIPTGTSCDDILELRVREISLEAKINNPRPYDCITGDTMWLEGINSTTGSGVQYEWIGLDGGIVESGGDSPIAVIRGAGRYVLTVKYGEGFDACFARDTVLVSGSLIPPIISCTSDGSSITFTWLPVPGAVDYSIDIDGIPVGNILGTSFTASGLSPLQQVTIGVQANGIAGCGSTSATAKCQAQDCMSIIVSVDSLAPICLGINDQPIQLTFQTVGGSGGGTTEWVSLGVNVNGIFDPKIVGSGTHNLNLIYSESGCNYIATRQVVVYEKPTATFEAVSPICITDESEITYTGDAAGNADFQWNFDGGHIVSGSGTGPYFVQWNTAGQYNPELQVTENSCASDLESQLVTVVAPLPAPVAECGNATTSSVEITWSDVPGATNYDVLLLFGRAGIRTGNTYRVTDMNPGEEITLVIAASGNNICGPSLDTITCFADNCPPVQAEINTIPQICLYDNLSDVDLNDYLSLSGNTPGAVITWSSSVGVLSDRGIFSPQSSGVGVFPVRVDIEDQGCFFFAEAAVEILEVPSVGFTSPAEICITENANIELTGQVLPGTNFHWNFGNGTSNIGNTGQGPFEISYPAAGTEPVQLWAELNGCFSDTIEQYIRITEPLPVFDINCETTTSSIDFSWSPTSGATGYQTTVLNVPGTAVVSQPDDFNINFSNLNPQQEVTIQVEISNNLSSCPPTIVEKTCAALDCPPIEIELSNINQFCLKPGEVGTPIDLNDYMTLTGDRGNATILWFGSNSVSSSGIFTPDSGDFGIHRITVEITEEGCVFTDNISINVFEIPTADFTAESPICISDFSKIELVSSAGSGTNFFWDLGNAAGQTGHFPEGPFNLTWDADGTDQISLFIEKDNCISDTAFAEIEIHPELIAPNIECTADLTQILFTWNDVPSATDYQVIVNDAPSSASSSQPDNFSFLVENLLPLDEVTITVEVSNNQSACPAVSTVLSCKTLPCPSMDIDFPNMPDICLYENIQPIDLTDFVVVSGPLQNGTQNWAGAGISPTGIFDPKKAGIGTHLMVFNYRELNCEYRETVEVTVHPAPIADAGKDQFISCFDSIVSIGGIANMSNPATVIYQWEGGQVENATHSNTTTNEIGMFILTATNSETGCIDTDTVLVNQGPEAPILKASIHDITCFGYNDGVIKVDTVLPGSPPYTFSLNGSPFLPHSEFQQLGPGDYQLQVRDAFGCTHESFFSVSEPDELTVELVIIADEIPVPLGDSIQLNAITNYAPEFLSNVQWTPIEQFPACDETNITNCLSVFVTPTGQTVYTVRVEHINGCAADDTGQILISKDRSIYIPSGFSPNNNDGINDVFRIYSGLKNVKNIHSFLVFDRWGELVHEYYNFLPEDDSHGWNGLLRGKKMQPNVFVYFAEVEFTDGSVEIFKGDVTLTK